MQEMSEYRPDGTSNFVRVGDRVKVLFPSKKTKVETRVVAIRGEGDLAQEVDVIDPRNRAVRTVVPSRTFRLQQTKNGERLETKV